MKVALAISLVFNCLISLWTPVIYIWCIKPNKSIQDGLRDWYKESENDI